MARLVTREKIFRNIEEPDVGYFHIPGYIHIIHANKNGRLRDLFIPKHQVLKLVIPEPLPKV